MIPLFPHDSSKTANLSFAGAISMKFLLIPGIFIILLTSEAFAGWQDTFTRTYAEKGIDQAVVNALSAGANPYQIIKVALPLDGLRKDHLIKALFCALAQPDTIQEAAAANGIEQPKVDEGYDLALQECARLMDEHLNSALDSSQHFPGNTSSSRESQSTNYASPWKFE